MAKVTVIIPTACDERRGPGLLRAIESVLTQQDAEAVVLLAVNGTRADVRLLQSLESEPRVLSLHRQDLDLPGARLWARGFVRTDYYQFLDDDDELLPGALATRLAVLNHDANLDVVVTNGYRRVDSADSPCIRDWESVTADPLLGLMQRNWLASCGGTYRARSVGADYWAGLPKYFEWTVVALRLLARARIQFLAEPTFRVHSTPGSLSKRAGYVLAEQEVLAQALQEARSARIRRLLTRKRITALHAASDYSRLHGRLGDAWKYHLSSLRAPSGWRHLPYTRKLFVSIARLKAGEDTAKSS